MATIKKACKGALYPKSSSVSRKLKSGGGFPDLNKDGKITKKDVLIGRGVLPKTAKKGMKIKKAQGGDKLKPSFKNLYQGQFGNMPEYKKAKATYDSDKNPKYVTKENIPNKASTILSTDTTGYAGGKKEFPGKMVTSYSKKGIKPDTNYYTVNRDAVTKSLKQNKKGGSVKKSAPKKMTMKKGGKMTKKCAYGCK